MTEWEPVAAKHDDIVGRYMAGERLDRIGVSLGLSMVEIRARLLEGVRSDRAARAAQSAKASIRERQRRHRRVREASSVQCVVCWGPLEVGRRTFTCGPECHADYQVAGYHLDPWRRQQSLLHSAKYMATHPDAVKGHQLRSARKRLSGAKMRTRKGGVNSARVQAAIDRAMAKRVGRAEMGQMDQNYQDATGCEQADSGADIGA